MKALRNRTTIALAGVLAMICLSAAVHAADYTPLVPVGARGAQRALTASDTLAIPSDVEINTDDFIVDIDGNITLAPTGGTVIVTGAQTISSTLGVTGTSEFTGACTFTAAPVLTDDSGWRTALGLVIGTDVQAWDADLDTYAGITPSSNVQSLLGAADYSAMRTLLSLVIGTDVQAWDTDLDTYAGITPSTDVQSLLGVADFSAMATLMGLEIGTDVQAWDTDLDAWATVTPSANGQSLVSAADYAAMKALLNLEIGTDVQAYDADLTTYAGITPSADIQTLLGSADNSAARSNLELDSMATQAKASVDIDGGAIDGTAIGANSASTGEFTKVTWSLGNYIDDEDNETFAFSPGGNDCSLKLYHGAGANAKILAGEPPSFYTLLSFSHGIGTDELKLHPDAPDGASFFTDAADGENEELAIYGYPTGESKKYLQFQIVSGPKAQVTSDSGEIDFDDENLTTSGSIEGGTLTDGTATLTSGAVTGTFDMSGATVTHRPLIGTDSANVADDTTTGGIPTLFVIDVDGGAAGNDDLSISDKVRVIDVWCVHYGGAGEASDTIQLADGSGNAITDAMDWSGADKTIVRAGEIDDAQYVEDTTLRVITTDDDGGTDVGAGKVFVLAIPSS